MADNSRELEILLKAKNQTEEAFRAIERATEQLEERTKKPASGFGKLRTAVNDFARDHKESFEAVGKGLSITAGGVATITAGIVALGVRGSTVLEMERSFGALARSVGDTGSEILKVTRSATKGLISDMDIMSSVNKGILLGLPITSREMGTLAQTAVVLGKAMKQGPTESLNDLIVGLGRGSPLILDNLGITINATEAYRAYAASIGKSADALSDKEKTLAIYRAALDSAGKKVEELGGIQLTFKDRLQQGRAWIGNTIDGLGKLVATSPAVNAAFDSIIAGMSDAFGGDTQELIQRFGGYVNSAAILLVDLAGAGVKTAKFITDAFYSVRWVMFGVLETITALVSGLLDAGATAVEFAAKLPGGSVFEGIAKGARWAADAAKMAVLSFDESRRGAEVSMSAADRMFDTVLGGLSTMRAAMVKAAAEAKPVALGLDDVAAGGRAVAEAAVEQSKQVEAWIKKAGELDEALRSANKNHVDATTILEQYGSTIEDVVREGQIFGRVIPKAIADAYAALNGKRLAEHMREWEKILHQIGIKSSEIARKQVDEQMKIAGQTGAALANALQMRRVYEDKTLDLTRTAAEQRLAALERERQEAIDKLGKPPLGMEEQWRQSTAAVNEYYDRLVQNLGDTSATVAGQLRGLAASLADTFGGIFGGLLGSAMATIDQIVAASNDKFSGLAGLLNSKVGRLAGVGAEGFTSGYGAGAQFGRGKGALAGAGSGFLTGAAAGSVLPGIGTVVGGVVGAVGGLLGGLFGGGKKARQEREELASFRADLLQTYGSLDNLRKIAGSVGVNIDKAFSTKKPAEAAAAVEELNRALTEQQKRLEGIATATAAINQRASGGTFGDLAGLIKKRDSVDADALMREANAIADGAWKAGRTVNSDEQKRFDALEAQWVELQKINEQIKQIGANGEAEFGRLGAYVSATFAGAVKETGDLYGALASLEPTFSILATAQKEFGYESSATLSKLLGFREVVGANKDVADSVSSLNQIMNGLGDASIVNRDLFQTFGEDAGAQIRILTERNVDLDSQMAMMQPTLQKLWEEQQRFGAVTDESTASLLKQAEQQGIVGAHMKSVNERILDVLLAIGDALGAKVPAGLETMRKAAETASGGVRSALDSVRDRAGSVAGSIEREFNNLDIRPLEIQYRYHALNERPDDLGFAAEPAPGYAVGGSVPFTPGGRLVRVAERETERIVSDSQLAAIVSRAMAAAGGSTQAGAAAAPSVIVKIGERELRPMVIEQVRGGLSNGEITVPRRNIVERGTR